MDSKVANGRMIRMCDVPTARRLQLQYVVNKMKGR